MIICDCITVTHEHGDYLTYKAHKCRCTPCVKANSEYNRAYRHLKKVGKFSGTRMPVAPVQAKLQELRDDYLPLKFIAEQVGINQKHLETIYYGTLSSSVKGTRTTRGHVSAENYKRIMGYQAPAYLDRPDHHSIPAVGSVRRVRALNRVGWPTGFIAAELGFSRSRLQTLVLEKRISVMNARKIRDVYETYWDKAPAPVTWQERMTVTRARNYAERMGYPPPMGLDDDRIDDPGYKPVSPSRPGVGARQLDLVAEVELLISDGGTMDSIPERLALSAGALEKRLARYGRTDLLKKIGWAA